MPAAPNARGPRRAARRVLEVLLAGGVVLAVLAPASVSLATHSPPEECTTEEECAPEEGSPEEGSPEEGSPEEGSPEGESAAPPAEEQPVTEAEPTTEEQTTTEEQSAPAVTEESIQAEQDTMRRFINQARRNSRDRRLKMRAALVDVARRQSARMADSGGIYHNPNLAGDLQRLRWRIAGENVGVGSTIENLHRAFMDSPAHRMNVLRKSFRYIGVGVVHANDRLWITIVFMG